MNSTQLNLPLPEEIEHAPPLAGGDVVWLYGAIAPVSALVAGEFEALFGRPAPPDPEARVGRDWLAWVHRDDETRVAAAFDAQLVAGGYDEIYRIVLPDGALRWVRDRAYPLGDDHIVRLTSDLTAERNLDQALGEERRQHAALVDSANRTATRADGLAAQFATRTDALALADSRLAEVERSHRLVAGALSDVVMRLDRESTVLDVFGPLELLPASPAELAGSRLAGRPDFPESLRRLWAATLERAFDTGRAQICDYTLEVQAGPREFEARVTPIAIDQALAIVREVTERNRLRERLQHIAMHDTLTGLANARALRERLADWIAREPPQHDRPSLALFVIDLDRFKQLNDLHGQPVGDTLLRLVAQRLQRAAGRDAGHEPIVARIGGDHFAVALALALDEPTMRADAFAGALARGMIAAIGEPARLHNRTVFARASIGVALFPKDGVAPATLFSNAEAALMRAKQLGRNQYRLYGDDAADGDRASARLAPPAPPNSERALRAALAAGEIGLVYQPKFELASSLEREAGEDPGAAETMLSAGAVIGVEALVRWQVADGMTLAPAQFIPLAEATGFIKPLGKWVLSTALKEVARFAESGAARVGVSVNISTLQLHDREFVRDVETALAESGFAAHELTLELAETAFVEDMRLVADTLTELAALGVNLAIDHFGIGTAGLVALKSLPIREIKIDRAFIAGCAIDAFDATIVAGLIEIAHNLGLAVTAEGVERADQIAFLSQVRCDAMQGYFVGAPMSAIELVRATKLWQNTRAARLRQADA